MSDETPRLRVYLETTIPSYLTAWPSRDLVMAARQQVTREWWDTRREEFDLFVSQVVIQEAREGDPGAAILRMEALQDISVLELTDEATALAQRLVRQVPLPARATVDAVHIAIAVVNSMDYLLTWNFTHIANATLRNSIEAVCRSQGFTPPVICTPDELMRGE
jgi:hypothetical protein